MNYKNVTNELQEICELPNGSSLYVKNNEVGGRIYWSDEIGGGVFVWDTALINRGTLLQVLLEEERFIYQEHIDKYRKSKNQDLT